MRGRNHEKAGVGEATNPGRHPALGRNEPERRFPVPRRPNGRIEELKQHNLGHGRLLVRGKGIREPWRSVGPPVINGSTVPDRQTPLRSWMPAARLE